ncbi:MAG: GNAT family N-acetyltransferase [bacterium]
MSNGIIYRQASITDTKKLSVLFKQVYIQTYGLEGVSDEFANFITEKFAIERLENIIKNNPDSIIVAENKNNLVGVIEIEFDKKCPVNNIVAPELSKLYILEWFCGQGIGKKLVEEAEKIVLSRGIREIWLWVLISNTRAISFYEKQQYECIGNAPFQMEVNSYENKVMLKKLN